MSIQRNQFKQMKSTNIVTITLSSLAHALEWFEQRDSPTKNHFEEILTIHTIFPTRVTKIVILTPISSKLRKEEP